MQVDLINCLFRWADSVAAAAFRFLRLAFLSQLNGRIRLGLDLSEQGFILLFVDSFDGLSDHLIDVIALESRGLKVLHIVLFCKACGHLVSDGIVSDRNQVALVAAEDLGDSFRLVFVEALQPRGHRLERGDRGEVEHDNHAVSLFVV